MSVLTLSSLGRSGIPHNAGLDPPGTRVTYQTASLDSEEERLSTFLSFPLSNLLHHRLARAGFYYTNYRDRTKCFCCGMAVEQWSANDNPKDAYFHVHGCRFIDNDSSLLSSPSNQEVINSRGANSSRPIIPNEQSRSPHNSIESQFNQSYSVNNPSSNHSRNSDLFPCLDPVNGYMKNLSERKNTFIQYNTWPRNFVRASTDLIAEAGFFYLGESDRVKCFYCNGGLQNWNYEDDPWTEHAKWFPNCEHLLKHKGPEFVANVKRRFPTIQPATPVEIRQVQSGPVSLPVRSLPNRSNVVTTQSNSYHNSINSYGTSIQNSVHVQSSIIMEPRPHNVQGNIQPVEQSRTNSIQNNSYSIDEIMRNNQVVQNAKDLGFSEDVIRHAVEIKLSSGDHTIENLTNLVEIMMQLEDEESMS